MIIASIRAGALVLIPALPLLLACPALVQAADEGADAPADARAKTYNSSRSNKSEGAAAPASSGDCDDADPCVNPAAVTSTRGTAGAVQSVKAQDYNSSRSNKARGERNVSEDDGCADCDEPPEPVPDGSVPPR